MIEPVFESVERIEEHQHALLGRLIARLRSTNEFWKERLERGGVDRTIGSIAEFVDRMPLLSKAELAQDQEQHPPYGSNLTFPLDDFRRLHQTSSTTGNPLRWLDTSEDWSALLDAWQVVFEAAEVAATDRLFLASSFGPFIGFWMAWDAAIRIGCLCIPGGGMNSITRLRAVLANEVTVLCCTPTYALHLGETARQEGINLSKAKVRRIIVAGEPGGSVPAIRARIEQMWPGARVFDHHGMTETGPVTFECPGNPGSLHVIESHYLCEVIDPQSRRPLPPNDASEGELVVTTLARTGSPVLRYRTGDIVRAVRGKRCSCGRWTMRLMGGVLGRADDMVVVRGTNVYPGAVAAIVAQFPEIVEHAVYVEETDTMTQLRLLIEPTTPDAGIANRVAEALHTTFNLRFAVECVEQNQLERFEFKARRWHRVPAT